VDTAEVMILDDNFAALEVDAKRVAGLVPANDEHILHPPSTRVARFGQELRVRFAKPADIVDPFGANHAAAALLKEPTQVRGNGPKLSFERCDLSVARRERSDAGT